MATTTLGERLITRVRHVELEVGDDGTARPFALVDPVVIDGRQVTRACLRSAGFIRDHDLHLGDAVAIESVDPPDVVEVLPLLRVGTEESLRLPNFCPACGCELRHQGDQIVCPSASCSQQLASRTRRLVAGAAFDIGELDDAAIDALIARGVIATPADVFRIHEKDLLDLGWQSERIAALARSVERCKRVSLERLLVATTGIPPAAAASIAAHARSLARVKRLAAGSIARLSEVGTSAAEAVANFMREPRNRRVLAQIARAGVTTLRVSAAADRLS